MRSGASFGSLLTMLEAESIAEPEMRLVGASKNAANAFKTRKLENRNTRAKFHARVI